MPAQFYKQIQGLRGAVRIGAKGCDRGGGAKVGGGELGVEDDGGGGRG